jgi:SAM-dependent methyltransferase
VGCGNGQKFLIPLYRAGFKNVAGCDPYLEEEDTDSGRPVIYKKDIFGMDGDWDVITFNHSFEHLENPMETLQKANRILKPGGYCIIRIPTASSYAWQRYGTSWFQLDAPRHYFLHSAESIRYLVDKTNFELIKTIFDSTHHQFTISERYKKGKTLRERTYNSGLSRLAHVVQKIVNGLKASRLNRQQRGDQAIFYLKKI